MWNTGQWWMPDDYSEWDLAEEMKGLQAELETTGIWLPDSMIWGVVMSVAVGTFALCALCYGVGCRYPELWLVPLKLVEEDPHKTRSKSPLQTLPLRRASYGVVNFLANASMFGLGLYLEIMHLRQHGLFSFLWNDHHSNALLASSPYNKIMGFADHPLDIAMPAMQVGKQLFAMLLLHSLEDGDTMGPLGMMLLGLHHMASLSNVFRSACFRTGFRWYIPYFTGICNWSSLFLDVYETVQNAPPHLRETYPTVVWYSRMFFALFFLALRIVAYIPRFVNISYLGYWYLVYHPNGWLRWFNMFCFGTFSILMALQLWWGYLIVKGILKVVTGLMAGGDKNNDSASTKRIQTATTTTAESYHHPSKKVV